MGTSKKSTTADSTAGIRQAQAAAIKASFPKKKLLEQFGKMGQAYLTEQEQSELRTETAYMVCAEARSFHDKAYGTGKGQSKDRLTILEAWRSHWKPFVTALAAMESPFIKLGEPNKAGEQKPIMTKYGHNVASTSRGVIEFGLPVHNDEGEPLAYNEISRLVREARKAADEKGRPLREAREALSDAIKKLRTVCGRDVNVTERVASIVAFIHGAMAENADGGSQAIEALFAEVELSEWYPEAEAEAEADETETDSETDDDPETGAETASEVPDVEIQAA